MLRLVIVLLFVAGNLGSLAVAPVLAKDAARADVQPRAGGDFSIDFTAAAPATYNHSTGGGAYNDRTIGKTNDVVESLEGGDFSCNDIVTFVSQITVDAGAVGAQKIQIEYGFTAHATGQQGVALTDLVGWSINYGAVENGGGGGAGTFGLDTGISDDGGSTATLISEMIDGTGVKFVKPNELVVKIEIDDLEASETVVLRLDVLLECNGDTPTGNMQADVKGAEVVDPAADTVNVGAQTIPFKQIGAILNAKLTIIKRATPQDGTDFAFETDFDVDADQNGKQKDFPLDVDGGLDATLDERASFGVDGNDTYMITELVPLGWTLTGATCVLTAGGAVSHSFDGNTNTLTVAVGTENVTCTFTNTQPITAIELVSFGASANGDTVSLDWVTGTERNNAGFNLYRADVARSSWTQVNSSLIAAHGSEVSGGSYAFTDRPAAGTYQYILEDVDTDGTITRHDPVTVTVGDGILYTQKLYLPTISH